MSITSGHAVTLYRVNAGPRCEVHIEDHNEGLDSVVIAEGRGSAEAFAHARAYLTRLGAMIDTCEAKEARRAAKKKLAAKP